MADQDTNVPNKNDFISREEMHKANRDEWEGVYGYIDCDIFEDNESMIDRVPAADVVEVVHGTWECETDFVYTDLSQRVICDKCGAFAYFYDKMPMNFCPNCGADMRETQILDTTKGERRDESSG